MTPRVLKFFMIVPLFSLVLPTFPSFAQSQVPYQEFGDALAEAAGHPGLARDEKALDTVLNDGFVTVKLGLFEVWHPRAQLHEGEIAKRFKSASQALLDLQEQWIDWSADDELKKGCLEEIKVLGKWVGAWNVRSIARRRDDEAGRPDLLELLKAKEEVSTVSQEFEHLMLTAGYMKREGEEGKNVLIVLAPTRESFLQLAGFMGSLNEINRDFLWQDRTALWTTFTCGEMHVIALEYPAAAPGNGDITQGTDMNGTDKTGLLQHVVLNASLPLIAHYQKEGFPSGLAEGLAMNMVIDLFQRINVRTGGGSKGGRAASYSAFVPGGNSSGGTLPGRKARSQESRWKTNAGKDRFLAMLKSAQKQGFKDAQKAKEKNPNKLDFFSLQSDAGAMGYAVQAPFFTEVKDREALPEDYVDDFKEFLRAYQCAFAYWIMTEAKNGEDASSSLDLLKRFLDDGTGQAAERVYGVPVSLEDLAADSLEGRFLAWLGR